MAAAIPPPIKASGSRFYKYSAFTNERREWLQEIVLQHRLYVPNLTQLNDLADGMPKLARKTENELFSFYYNGRGGVLARNPRMSVEDQIREGLILDYNLKLHGTEVVMRGTAKSLYDELADWRIYCLCKRCDNVILWGYYADSHRGYCLEFANVGPFFGSALEVSYGEPQEFDITKREQLDGRWFFRKREGWSHEEEVRVLVPRKSNPKIDIDPAWLTRLILGSKMPEPDRKQIRDWAKQRSPELKVVDASWDELDQVVRIGI